MLPGTSLFLPTSDVGGKINGKRLGRWLICWIVGSHGFVLNVMCIWLEKTYGACGEMLVEH